MRVAPHAGARIETLVLVDPLGDTRSRPTRARGLKQLEAINHQSEERVAPHAGARIETW